MMMLMIAYTTLKAKMFLAIVIISRIYLCFLVHLMRIIVDDPLKPLISDGKIIYHTFCVCERHVSYVF